jgi:hypothetical protein
LSLCFSVSAQATRCREREKWCVVLLVQTHAMCRRHWTAEVVQLTVCRCCSFNTAGYSIGNDHLLGTQSCGLPLPRARILCCVAVRDPVTCLAAAMQRWAVTRQHAVTPLISLSMMLLVPQVAACLNGRIDTVANESGNRYTPSVVLFDPAAKEWLVGESAVSKAPKIQMGSEGTVDPSPSKVFTLLLGKLRSVGEAYMGARSTGALITVSPRFGQEHYAAVEKAAAKAGFKSVVLMQSTAAALIGHDLDVVSSKTPSAETVLVLHVGGAGVDTSVFRVVDGTFELLGSHHDASVCGNRFDDLLVDFCLAEFKKKYRTEVSGKRALTRLRQACEEAKRSLSTNARVPIEIDSLFEGLDFAVTITRSRFEDICFALIKGITKVRPVENGCAVTRVASCGVERCAAATLVDCDAVAVW